MHHPRHVNDDRGVMRYISSNTTLFISRMVGITTTGSAQLHVSATNIRHRQVVHRTYRLAISHMCGVIWRVWDGVGMERDLACIGGGCIVWGYYGIGVVIGSHALL
jgi:hypothetical protein